jgi:Asp-tRNA(Asn)/Glu-tRNA(Gln) amidotransferase B subunit
MPNDEQMRHAISDPNQAILILEEMVIEEPVKFTQAKTDEKIRNWFVGQVMKETHGAANPSKIAEHLNLLLDRLA